jgi:hypothetical protein
MNLLQVRSVNRKRRAPNFFLSSGHEILPFLKCRQLWKASPVPAPIHGLITPGAFPHPRHDPVSAGRYRKEDDSPR